MTTPARIPTVRRFLLLFLLIVLPIQLVWGASVPYCAHEKAASAKHFGHHSHQHEAQPKAESGAGVLEKTAVLADDADCAVCHLGCVQPSLNQTSPVVEIRTAALARTTVLPVVPGCPGRIERPKWSLAA